MWKNQEVRGDDKPMSDKGSAQQGEYDKSLGGAERTIVQPDNGYTAMGRISKDTQSDKGGDA